MPATNAPTLFISDLHLSVARPGMMQLFLYFLQEEALHARHLYILGDFFEFWVGRGAEQEAANRDILSALRHLTAQGVPVSIMGGNRDFMLDTSLRQLCGADFLKDPTVIDLQGSPCLLTHGDLLCTDDLAYQRFRRIIQHPLTRLTLGNLPYAWRTRLAGGLRQASQDAMQQKTAMIMDVNPDAVLAALRGQRPYPPTPDGRPYPLLIHGHTHRPGIHEIVLDGQHCRRIVLGDWYETGSVLRSDARGIRLENFGSGTADNC
ncbi:UDP-2,3-diacylglucosamine diphosphatase [Thermithiobacillus plumbiphilus]|uniref:UDP-2,3-diacylglucosamine hydrolase n=1 Tax=Thermithiobacillus plumbiphilus TaxID=1729899 RepID=A0ABU9DAU4_9PROT